MRRVHRYFGVVDCDSFSISQVATLPEFRGRGIGRLLIERTLRTAELAGVSKIILDVSSDNESAIHLYHKIGFKVVLERKTLVLEKKSYCYYKMAFRFHNRETFWQSA